MNIKDTLLRYIQRRTARIPGDFKRLWKNYLYQSFLAACTLAIVLLALNMEDAVVIASIGATAFIVFTMPKNITAMPRRVIGGHIIGLISGSLISFIPHNSEYSCIMVYALAVGISILLMVALNFEHPPAAGTALGVAMTGFSVTVLIAVITSSVILSLAHRFLRRYLRELT
jgi:CBS-domain-containing membrane protein